MMTQQCGFIITLNKVIDGERRNAVKGVGKTLNNTTMKIITATLPFGCGCCSREVDLFEAKGKAEKVGARVVTDLQHGRIQTAYVRAMASGMTCTYARNARVGQSEDWHYLEDIRVE